MTAPHTLQPRWLRWFAWLAYVLFSASGIAFSLTKDAESLRIIVGDWAPWVTGIMLVAGGAVGFIGSVTGRLIVEVAAYPFLVGVWVVYAASIATRYFEDGTSPLGFALLLAGGATALVGRALELFYRYDVEAELVARQTSRSTA